jgi:hypothetical protein
MSIPKIVLTPLHLLTNEEREDIYTTTLKLIETTDCLALNAICKDSHRDFYFREIENIQFLASISNFYTSTNKEKQANKKTIDLIRIIISQIKCRDLEKAKLVASIWTTIVNNNNL